MTIFFEDESNESLPFKPKEITELVVEKVLAYMDFPYEAEVSLLLATSEDIRAVNLEFRQMAAVTDVLSFPAVEFVSAWDEMEDIAQLEENGYFNPETGEFVLGDIMICVSRVIEQANEYGHTVHREFAFLIVHSLLHLLGYDHLNDEDRHIMEEKQRRIMEYLEISR